MGRQRREAPPRMAGLPPTQLMRLCTDLARLCPRGQAVKSDSVGKGAQRSVPTPCSTRCAFAHPTRWSQSIEIRPDLVVKCRRFLQLRIGHDIVLDPQRRTLVLEQRFDLRLGGCLLGVVAATPEGEEILQRALGRIV